MEFKNIYVGIIVSFVIALAFASWALSINNSYVPLGGAAIDTGFYSDFEGVYTQAETYKTDIGGSLDNTSSTVNTPSQDAFVQGRGSFSSLKSMIGFVPSMFNNASEAFHIPKKYIEVAGWTFVVTFSLTVAYLLVLGVRRFIG
jgi:hypothetical protein